MNPPDISITIVNHAADPDAPPRELVTDPNPGFLAHAREEILILSIVTYDEQVLVVLGPTRTAQIRRCLGDSQ